MTYQFPGFTRRLHLDYETASEVNLKTAGAHRYAEHESTRVLMLGWAFDDEQEQLWEPHKGPMPDALLQGLLCPSTTKVAYNAQFERLITRDVVGIDVPTAHWRCTMVMGYYLGFAGGLDQMLSAIGKPGKDKRGNQLINVFCKPAAKNHKADWYDYTNKPHEWEEFCDYCRQDVRVERVLLLWLVQFPVMHSWDWTQWFVDQQINDRGVPMDVDMAYAAIEVWDSEKKALTEELQEATQLPKVTRDPFKAWFVQRFGVELENLSKDYLQSLLHKGTLPEEARYFVDLWAQKEAKAVSKYTAVINGACGDGRARGMFQYKGASRTDRVGGRRIQLQNLKRSFVDPTEINVATVVGAIKTTSSEMLRMMYPQSVSLTLGGSIRHVIAASPGKTFAVCDLTSIESVVLGWISQCPEIDATYRDGRDAYKMFATKYYGIDYSEVTKAQRGFSKPPVLGCGFMLGWKGLIAYAEGYGVDMEEEEAKRAVSTFRNMYPEIPMFWKWIYDAVKYVVSTGQSISGYRLTLERDADFLRIWLPSGRALSYYKPEVKKRAAPWAEKVMTDKAEGAPYEEFLRGGWTDQQMIAEGYMQEVQFLDNFTYMGMNDKNQWVRIFAHAGGVTENIVQSIAGDFLWSGITNATTAGLPVILHVHDEIAVEVDAEPLSAQSSLALLEQCMVKQPDWAQDMWLGADGYILSRYTKD